LIKWNSKHRIIGSTDPTWLADHLLLDSLVFLHVIPPTVKCLVDIGSGAGLPGLPIKIVRPDIRMLLVESRQRRASFLKAAVRELELVDVEILSERVLSVPSRWRKAFDVAVARCAGDVESTLKLGLGFVRAGGMVAVSGPPDPCGVKIGRYTVVQFAGGRTRSFVVDSA